jgi:fructokinase
MGIDLGGSKTEVIVLDPDQRPVYRERVATPAGSYAEILALLANLVTGIEAKLKFDMKIGRASCRERV